MPRRRRIVVDQHAIGRRADRKLAARVDPIGVGDLDAVGEHQPRHRIAQPVDPQLGPVAQQLRDRTPRQVRHLLDRPVEHDVFEPQRAGQRAIVALERRREGALLREVGGLARRDQPVVDADAQRIVAVDRLQTAHHRERSATAPPTPMISTRGRSPLRCRSRIACSSSVEHLRVGAGRLFEHRIVTPVLAVEPRRPFHHSNSATATATTPAAAHWRAGAVRARREDRDRPAAGTAPCAALRTRRQRRARCAPRRSPPRRRPRARPATTAAASTQAPARQAVAHVVGEQMAGEDRERRHEHEVAVDRTAEEVHARHPVERPAETAAYSGRACRAARRPAPRSSARGRAATARRRRCRTRAAARPAPSRRTDS